MSVVLCWMVGVCLMLDCCEMLKGGSKSHIWVTGPSELWVEGRSEYRRLPRIVGHRATSNGLFSHKYPPV